MRVEGIVSITVTFDQCPGDAIVARSRSSANVVMHSTIVECAGSSMIKVKAEEWPSV